MISETHGGRRKAFEWQLVDNKLLIRNEEGREHVYPLSETLAVLQWLHERFDREWFPLANNVELMHKGEERPGLGTAILKQAPNDISHAQGSSYLGVVLEETGFLEWNGARRGIEWRIIRMPKTIDQLAEMIDSDRTTAPVSQPRPRAFLSNIISSVRSRFGR